jgi:hypothetical protein
VDSLESLTAELCSLVHSRQSLTQFGLITLILSLAQMSDKSGYLQAVFRTQLSQTLLNFRETHTQASLPDASKISSSMNSRFWIL